MRKSSFTNEYKQKILFQTNVLYHHHKQNITHIENAVIVTIIAFCCLGELMKTEKSATPPPVTEPLNVLGASHSSLATARSHILSNFFCNIITYLILLRHLLSHLLGHLRHLLSHLLGHLTHLLSHLPQHLTHLLSHLPQHLFSRIMFNIPH